ncbi:olfactory receptor 226-like [Rana temporaria]|uniref:olfactory receptor 226-like n=1 Tax=Rana temporaria TaxID=8407 RepID=UPI001AADF5D6|nr:olfactory receptor 226-like [Rana temporaria]
MANQTTHFEFELTGFPGVPQNFHMLASFILFIMYIIMFITNGAVFVLIILKEKLHKPMYALIANLAFSDFLFDAATLPKMICKYWFDGGKISVLACFVQMHLVHWLAGMDCLILMLMAFDRYIAICNPLRYSSTITIKLIVFSCGSMWFTWAAIQLDIILIATHPFCGPNKVLSFFCNASTVMRLVCDDVNSTREILLIVGLVVLFGTLALIMLSYMAILYSVLSLSHSDGWWKAFYTCVTHLIVIILFYVPRVFVYIANYVKLVLTPDLGVFLIVLQSYLPHLANPFIYCLRTEEIKNIISSTLKIKC